MIGLGRYIAPDWRKASRSMLPFADAASDDLPLAQLLRLSLFQVTVGMAIVLLNGTLNRVMIVEMGVPTWLVALMISIPLLVAPFRALIGHRSDMHRSFIGWRRVPYLWFGSLLQFGGLAIMPFALFLLSGDTTGPAWIGHAGAALAFLLVGLGLHTTQTAGLALATDLAPEESRPRVVALLYVMLLIGMIFSAIVFGLLLDDFSQLRMIQVIQGAAVFTLIVNVIALWRQEVRRPGLTRHDRERESFREAWATFTAEGQVSRVLLAVGLGTAAFGMQDVLLEPYGGEILGLSVSATTFLTALLALGTLAGFGLAARYLARGGDAYRLAALGAVAGIPGFSAVIFSAPLESAMVFRAGTVMIGLGSGLFAVGALTAAMGLARETNSGMALGVWGAVQASAAGGGIALGGIIRDTVQGIAETGALGEAFMRPDIGYSIVYHTEILLLFLTLVVIGPLAKFQGMDTAQPVTKFGIPEFPN